MNLVNNLLESMDNYVSNISLFGNIYRTHLLLESKAPTGFRKVDAQLGI